MMLSACSMKEERITERERMVHNQIERRGIREPSILDAMRIIPRHNFVPHEWQALAYDDNPLPIGFEQTISQPFIVAYMTRMLGVNKSSTILEIGTGCGYQTAVLSVLAKEVYSIEIISGLCTLAKNNLNQQFYDNIHLKCGDGYEGWPKAAPFDGIIVTAAPGHIPGPLKEQLAIGGRLVIPVGKVNQELIVITRTPGGFQEKKDIGVRFVPMTGQAEH